MVPASHEWARLRADGVVRCSCCGCVLGACQCAGAHRRWLWRAEGMCLRARLKARARRACSIRRGVAVDEASGEVYVVDAGA